MTYKPTCVELFAGAGGLALGLKQAGFTTVFANDVDPDGCASFELNHPESEVVCGDIHDIDFCDVKDRLAPDGIDLVAGGPPCQGFSTVGSKNERDPRNSLFYEFIRAVSELSPKCILFENVSGFKRMYHGRAFDALVTELNELGYTCVHGVLNASDYGLPQHRKRTVVLGWKSDSTPIQLPVPSHASDLGLFNLQPRRTLMEAISDLPPLSVGDAQFEYKTEPQNEYQQIMRDGVAHLTEHNSAKYGHKMQEILSLIPKGGSINDLPERLRPKSYFGNTYARTRNFGTPSSSRCVHPFQNRALSTRDGARLQSFPDSYKFVGGKGSKNLQIGNAVPPILGRALGRVLFNQLVPQGNSMNTKAAAAEPACEGGGWY